MFALAHLGRAEAGRLMLARDRAGKKPLFSIEDGTRAGLRLGDQGARSAHPDLSVEPRSTDAVPSYFLYGYVPHPRTFYRDVRHVEPGIARCSFDRDGHAALAALLAADVSRRPMRRPSASPRRTPPRAFASS